MRRSRLHRAVFTKQSAARRLDTSGRDAELPDLILATLAGDVVAIPTTLAGELARCPGIAPLPGSDPAVLGVVAVRARPLVAVCPAWLLGHAARPAPTTTPLVILTLITAWGRIALPLDQPVVRTVSTRGLTHSASTKTGTETGTSAAPRRLSGLAGYDHELPLLDAAACDQRLALLHDLLADPA